MGLRELAEQSEACRPRSAEHWVFASLLSTARRLSNEGRGASADRGPLLNQKVVLHGALGELLLFGIVRQLPKSATAVDRMLAHVPYVTGGCDINGPDLAFVEDGRAVGIDVNSFDCSLWKCFFAIDERKHVELAGECVGYVGLIYPPFARSVCITRLIPHEDVSIWRCEAWGKQDPPRVTCRSNSR